MKFDPNKQEEVWRYFTYMVIHDNWYHLILNVVIQCLIAIPLERQQDSIRVGLLYLGGGFLGALGAACTSPDYVIGASAGVYALLISHISDLLLNFKSIRYKKTRFIVVGMIVMSDVIYNAVHFYKDSVPSISWGAHVFGAIAGLIFGLMIYKTYNKIDKQLSKEDVHRMKEENGDLVSGAGSSSTALTASLGLTKVEVIG
ncbi:rho-6 [Trypoxylus dichotomus]